MSYLFSAHFLLIYSQLGLTLVLFQLFPQSEGNSWKIFPQARPEGRNSLSLPPPKKKLLPPFPSLFLCLCLRYSTHLVFAFLPGQIVYSVYCEAWGCRAPKQLSWFLPFHWLVAAEGKGSESGEEKHRDLEFNLAVCRFLNELEMWKINIIFYSFCFLNSCCKAFMLMNIMFHLSHRSLYLLSWWELNVFIHSTRGHVHILYVHKGSKECFCLANIGNRFYIISLAFLRH